MVNTVNKETIDAALELREKVDRALSMGISAETIGAALMVERGLDSGKASEFTPPSLDSLLIAGTHF